MRRILVSGAATFAAVSALALVATGGPVWRTTSSTAQPTAASADPAERDASDEDPASSGVGGPSGTAAERRDAAVSRAVERSEALIHDELTAARDAVAAALQRREVGDFVVDIDPGNHRLTVVTEATDTADARDGEADADHPDDGGTGRPDVRVIHADERVDRKIVTAIESASDTLNGDAVGRSGADPSAIDEPADQRDAEPDQGDRRADAGGPPPGDRDAVDVEVEAAREIVVEPLGDSPTAFPPYEAGLHVDVGSGNRVAQCTAGYTFADATAVYGSTAGHCGRIGDPVTVGTTVIDAVAVNPFQGTNQVRADVALYSLSRNGWAHRPVLHLPTNHPLVVGSLTDQEITRGLELCFAGRATTEPSCGPVNAAHRVICCDANDKSFVFTCTDRAARAGDSGTAVFQRLDPGRIVAAGLLSSSVTIDGRSSMCFSTVDNIQSETGTTIVTASTRPVPPVPAPDPGPAPPAPPADAPTPPPGEPAPPDPSPAPAPEQPAPAPPSLPAPAPAADPEPGDPSPPAEQPAPPPGSGAAAPSLGTALGRVLGR